MFVATCTLLYIATHMNRHYSLKCEYGLIGRKKTHNLLAKMEQLNLVSITLFAENMIRDIEPVLSSYPAFERVLQGTVYEGINSEMFYDVVKDASAAFTQGVNIATTPQQSYGGGGVSDTPWRDKDEDYEHFARRCLHWSLKRNKPRKGASIDET